jgi:hypothetical protein
MGLILLLVLVLLFFAVLPAWPCSRKWGYYPSAGVFAVVMSLLALTLLGYL